jgi:hypothetical protein
VSPCSANLDQSRFRWLNLRIPPASISLLPRSSRRRRSDHFSTPQVLLGQKRSRSSLRRFKPHKLGLVDRSDPATMAVAKLIIEFAKAGERDPERLCALALQALSK